MKTIKKTPASKRSFSIFGTLNAISKLFELRSKTNAQQFKPGLGLLSLEERIVPAVPFSPAYPHVLSIVNGSSPVSNTASFTVTFNQAVTGVDASDFQLDSSGTVSGGTISSVTGSGTTHTVKVSGISGNGTIALSLVDLPSIMALPSFGPKSIITTASAGSFEIGDVNGDGKPDIVVADFYSDKVTVHLGNGDGSFQSKLTFLAGKNPSKIKLADVNGDGLIDIQCLNLNSNDVSVLLGKGNGYFQTQQVFAIGKEPSFITLGDFNRDGRLDIITANRGSNNISVLLGNGDGTFQSQKTFATGYSPTCVDIGDVNNDGRIDIAVCNMNSYSAGVLIGNGDGSFQDQKAYDTGFNSLPSCLKLGDFNEDGILDIVTSHTDVYYGEIGILFGKSNGTFGSQATFSTGLNPYFLSIGDMNGDGKLDIVTSNNSSNDLSILLGNGNGTFQSKFSFEMGGEPRDINMADLNNDGRLDIVNINNDGLNILLGTGGNTESIRFNSPSIYPANDEQTCVAVGDINNDGFEDIITGSMIFICVLLGDGKGGFESQSKYFCYGSFIQTIALGDINRDGKTDVFTTNSDGVNLLLGKGDGSFQDYIFLDTGPMSVGGDLGDLNGDGIIDIAVANLAYKCINIFLGNGDGSFKFKSSIAFEGLPVDVKLADVNRDGHLDAVSAHGSFSEPGSTIQDSKVFLGNGDGTFQSGITFAKGKAITSFSIEDLNNDGKIDICLVDGFFEKIEIMLGNGDGSFNLQASIPRLRNQTGWLSELSLGDLNGDGKVDICMPVNFHNLGLGEIILGNGDGTFQGEKYITLGNGIFPSTPALGDLNNDGRTDLVMANYGSESPNMSVSVLFNSLSFSSQPTIVQNKIQSSTALSTSLNPSLVGQAVIITAVVTGSSGTATPSGTITFRNGSTVVATLPLSSGVASLTTSSFQAGNGNTITAEYSGDFVFLSSKSNFIIQIANQAPVITSGSQASFLVGKSASYSLAATGYPAPVFSLDSGSLPAGVGLMADGKLQGVALPGSKGSYSFTVKASNAGGSTAQNYTVAVSQEGVFAMAAMGGGSDFSKLAIYKNGTTKLLREVIPFPGFKGEFYVSSGDITGDGIEDIAVGSGQGSQNGHVVVFDGALLLNPNPGKAVELPYKLGGSVRASLYAFVGYSSGVAVRLADMNDDGFDDMVLAPGTGAGTSTPAHLRVWNGKDCMADFEAGKPLPYDYRWEMASFWAFGEGSNPGGGMALSVIRQAGPDLIIASQLFRGGSKVFRYDGQKVLTTVVDLTGWQDLSLTGNTVVGFDREGNRFFANGGTDNAATDTIYVRDKDKKAAYTIDRVFGGTPGGLRLGLANMDEDAEDELLVIRGMDSTTKVYDLFADKAVLIDTLKPGGNSGWV